MMEGTLVRDRNKDTLLYAGSVKVSITDWFFLKDEVELHYIGLEDAQVYLHRKDSVWNYQFLANYFTSPGPKDTSAKQINLVLQRLELKNIRFRQRDEWIGQDMSASIGYMNMHADEINFEKKKIFIRSLDLRKPYFALRDYQGLRTGTTRKKTSTKNSSPKELQWNPGDWDMLVKSLTIREGRFTSDLDNHLDPDPYFDGAHIDFRHIDGNFEHLSWQKDTITARIKLATKERSGFQVNTLTADFTMHPKAMIFQKMDLVTPHSRLSDYYAMRYDDFNMDMGNYIERVTMEGRFKNGTLSSRDLAYFAPELRHRDATIRVSGNVSGTVNNLTAKSISLQYGRTTRLEGNIRLKGLPDIEQTYIELEAGDLRTNYAEALKLAPELAAVKGINLASLGTVSYRGNYKGLIGDFSANGTIRSDLGAVRTDVKMKLPAGKEPSYAGLIETDGFQLGTLLGEEKLGKISFQGDISGSGFSIKKSNTEINGTIREFEYNGYLYQNLSLKGKLLNREFNGEGIVDDPNLRAYLKGNFNLNNEKEPEFNILLDVQRGNLMPIRLAKSDITVLGKFRLNFKGETIDDFIGEASLYDVAFQQAGQLYVFDTLHLYSMKIDQQKQLEIYNSDIYISLNGIFNLSELPNTLNAYLSKYYPRYFDVPKKAIASQDFSFQARLRNIDQYLPLLAKGLRGFDQSEITGRINTNDRNFLIDAKVPYMSYNDIVFSNLSLDGLGDRDSLRLFARSENIVINDSLQIPAVNLSVRSSSDFSDISLTTSATQKTAYANLSLRLQNLKDGVRVHFNPSSFVLNEKTWRIERDGELTISRSFIDAEDIRIVNGEQEILIAGLPSEIGNSNDILISLKRVNLGDLLPYVLTEPKIEGITSGDITIEDPYNKFRVYLNAQTDQTRFEGDSIGITTLSAFWDNNRRMANYFLSSNNRDYIFDVKGNVNLEDSLNQFIETDIELRDTRIDILEKYLVDVFSDLNGKVSGKLRIIGNLREPDLTGKIQLEDAGLKVAYTSCYYSLNNTEIEFTPDRINFGTLKMKDALGNEGTMTGSLTHHFFRDFSFDFNASSPKMLLLNTTKMDNSIFYGKAIGRVNFFFRGPEKEMRMYVNAEVVDSSEMSIVTSSNSKSRGEAEYIVWRQYGREMNLDSLVKASNNLLIDLDLRANPMLKMNVILDELTGDIITATGSGNIKIHTGTSDDLTLDGRYDITKGNYNFNFQDIFKKPFVLEEGSGSFISWTGNPYDAEINIRATYMAERVAMSSLFSDASSTTVSGVSSDVLREYSDVAVVCNLTGTLGQPNPSFQIQLPSNSPIKNNPTVDAKLKSINRDPLEVSKQSTYLIVFKSFAPQAAIVSSNLNQDLINNTISGVINTILASSVQNFFYKLFGSSVDVNFAYSRVSSNPNQSGTTDQNNPNAWRENVSLEFIKSLLNNKLVITFGSDFNFSTNTRTASGGQNFIFLPDVTVEYKITPDGRFRTSFFYRSNFDALSTSGRTDRTGGNISYRTEFDRILPRKKKKPEATLPRDSEPDASVLNHE